jgi:hypothetical protein
MLPLETKEWKQTQQQSHESYENFKKELIVKPRLKQEEEDAKMIDHPLSTA